MSVTGGSRKYVGPKGKKVLELLKKFEVCLVLF